MFALLGGALLHAVVATSATPELTIAQPWIHGLPGEPLLQVQNVAPGTWILRQSKTTNFEAPFLYLLAGTERALLLDSGAEAKDTPLPPRSTVDGLLEQWSAAQQEASAQARTHEPWPLIVAHSHAHGDHHANDEQFRERPDTQVVELPPEAVAKFFAMKTWPTDAAQFDLGERTLDELAIPGHEPAHIAIYDRETESLLTGDSVYPGLLTVRDLAAYTASMARLQAFARAHPVQRVLGAHIEMAAQAGELYPIGSPAHPDEHELALPPETLGEIAYLLPELGVFIGDVVYEHYALTQVTAPPTDKPSTHGMLSIGSAAIYFSHLPMFHSPHDYQLIFEASLPEPAASGVRELYAEGRAIVTVVPTAEWVLPATIKVGASFDVDVYRGHFERGGTRVLESVPATVKRIVHFRRFDSTHQPDPAAWLAFGQVGQRFLAHRIEGAPDFDQVVEVEPGASLATQLRFDVKGPLTKAFETPNGRVRRVIYTETGDLTSPAINIPQPDDEPEDDDRPKPIIGPPLPW